MAVSKSKHRRKRMKRNQLLKARAKRKKSALKAAGKTVVTKTATRA